MAEFKGNNNQKVWELMGYNYTTGVAATPKNRQGLSNAITRDNGIPLDLSMLHATYADAVVYAATKSIAYVDQILAAEGVVYIVTSESQGKLEVTSYRDSLTGAITTLETPQEFDIYIKPIGIIPTGDGKTISVTEDGEIAIIGADGATAEQVLRIKEDGTGVEWVDASDIVEISAFAENAIVRKDDGIYANITTGESPAPEGVAKRYYINVNNSKSGVNIDIPYDARLEGIGHDTTVAAYIADKVASAGHLKREIVEALPTENIDEETIYMVLDGQNVDGDVYVEYMYIDGKWEKIGDTQTSLAGYATEEYVTNLIGNYYTKQEVVAMHEGHAQYAENTYATKETLNTNYYTKYETQVAVAELNKRVAENYATKAELEGYALDGDSYLKAETYSKTQIDKLLEDITGGSEETAGQVQTNLEMYARANDIELFGADAVNAANPEGTEGYISPNTQSGVKSRIDLLEEDLGTLDQAVSAIPDELEKKLEEIKVDTTEGASLANLLKIVNNNTISDNGLVAVLADKATVGTVSALSSRVDGHETRLGTAEQNIGTIQTYIETHKGEVNTINGSIESILGEIAGLKQVDAGHNTELSRLGGEITRLDGYYTNLADLVNNDGIAVRALIDAEAARATAAEEGLSNSIKAIYQVTTDAEGKTQESGVLAAVKTQANTNAAFIQNLNEKIKDLSNVMEFRGAVTPTEGYTNPNLDTAAIATLGEVQHGDVILYGQSEYVYDSTKPETERWVEFGNVSANATAIASLQEIVGGHTASLKTLNETTIPALQQGLDAVPGAIADAIATHANIMANTIEGQYYSGHVKSSEKATFVDGELTGVSTDLLVQGKFELVLNGGNSGAPEN